MANKKHSPRRRARTVGGVIERLDALATKDNAAARRRVDEMLAKILIRNDLVRLREKRGQFARFEFCIWVITAVVGVVIDVIFTIIPLTKVFE